MSLHILAQMEKEIKSASAKPLKKLLEELNVEFPSGLSSMEATTRLIHYGKNKMIDPPKTSVWRLALSQFEDKMVQLLLLAAFLSFMISVLDGVFSDVVEPGIILLILVLNALVGVFQEMRAEGAIEALKAYSAISAVVHRNGKPHRISAEDLVPGDVVELSEGDRVPADIRLVEIKSTTFRTSESVLTGEAKEVIKTVECLANAQRYPTNMAFCGTDVVYGRAIGIVLHTGMATEVGCIQRLVESQSEVRTPLQSTLDEFGTVLSKLIGGVCVVVFLTTMLHWYRLHLSDVELSFWGNAGVACIHSLKIAVALAVAAIPEGLPAVVTTCLALGARRLSHQNALIRDLPSVETLGRCSVVCCDKTGTLTTGMMSVVEVCTLNPLCDPQTYELRNAKYIRVGDAKEEKTTTDSPVKAERDLFPGQPFPASLLETNVALRHLSLISVLCNEATLEYNAKKKTTEKIGSATEAALLIMAEELAVGAYLSSLKGKEVDSSLSSIDGECTIKSKRVHTLMGDLCRNDGDAGIYSFRAFVEACWSRKATLEFTRCRKSMSVISSWKFSGSNMYTTFLEDLCIVEFDPSKHNLLMVKGAPEELLSRSTSIMLSDGSHSPLTDAIRKSIDDQLNRFATTKALRLLSFAFKVVPQNIENLQLSDPSRFVEVEECLTFVGTCGMLDPPREEITAAVAQCRKSGVKILVITGDRKETAVSVCQKIGLLPSFPLSTSQDEKAFEEYVNKIAFTGSQLNAMSFEERKKAVLSATIFCRTDPSHKMQLVQLLQDQNLICAMTGDGVNDAPALKRADMGIAMGSGSEVAKSASNMILADDNFATIVNAIQEGRRVFSNTKQFIRYLISSNIGEVVCVLVIGFFAGVPELLTPIQLLWVNLVTDGLPATALSFNPTDIDTMAQPPRPVDEPIISSLLLFFRYVLIGFYIGIATVASYLWWFIANGYSIDLVTDIHSYQKCMELSQNNCDAFVDPRTARAIALSTLVMVEMFNALNSLSENNSIFVVPPSRNVWLLTAIFSSVLLHCIIMYVPFFANMLGIVPLGVSEKQLDSAPLWSFLVPTQFKEWAVILICSFPVVIVDEVMKYVTRQYSALPKSKKGKKK